MANDDEGRWCILRTSAGRTLKLVRSLADAGLDVWTPEQTVTRRRGRARERVETLAPITPTFVFAKAAQLAEWARLEVAPVSLHPPFSIFRHRDRVPLITDQSLSALRDEEQRHQRKQLKAQRRVIAPGTQVRLAEGAFAGMTGVVESGDGKGAVVNFGAGFSVRIATYLLPPDVLRAAPQVDLGLAA